MVIQLDLNGLEALEALVRYGDFAVSGDYPAFGSTRRGCARDASRVRNQPRLMSCRFRHVVIEPCNHSVREIFDMHGIMESVPFARIHHQLGFYVK
jgi:hypothetical protein